MFISNIPIKAAPKIDIEFGNSFEPDNSDTNLEHIRLEFLGILLDNMKDIPPEDPYDEYAIIEMSQQQALQQMDLSQLIGSIQLMLISNV